MSNSVCLITGASGFVGRSLVYRMSSDGFHVRAAVRRQVTDLPTGVESTWVGDQAPDTDWGTSFGGVAAVVHCAARVHVLRESSADPMAEYRRVNVAGTLNLACQAADAGVRRFVFISSIGVNGTETFEIPFTADDKAAPHSPYAIAKHEAELGLRQIAQKTGLEVVIIRPPLVFGPNAPGNFNRLLRIVHKGIPLPFGAIHNKRSLVAVDNLVDLILTTIQHPAAANQTFLAGDGEDLSTPELLRRMGRALGEPAKLLSVPTWLLESGAALLGKQAIAQRLCGSLQVDIGKSCELLRWRPPVTLDEALSKTALHFLKGTK